MRFPVPADPVFGADLTQCKASGLVFFESFQDVLRTMTGEYLTRASPEQRRHPGGRTLREIFLL